MFLEEDIDIEDFIFGHDYGEGRKGLLEYRVKLPTIHNMYSLINMSLIQEIERTLKRRGLAPWDKKCGTCDHRALFKPHSCQLEYFPTKTLGRPCLNWHFGIERMEGDAPCDGYQPTVPQDSEFDDDAPPIEGGIIRSYSALWLGARTWKEQLEHIHAIRDIPVMFMAIQRCVKNASPQKTKEKFQRWNEDNTYIYQRLTDNKESYAQAKSRYLDERTDNDEDREAYATQMRRDKENLGKCLSGEERCRERSGPGGE